MMKSINGKILAVGGLIAFLVSTACENIALIKRPMPQLDGDEIVGEITSIDPRLRQIHFRPVTEASVALRHRHFDLMTILESFIAAANIP